MTPELMAAISARNKGQAPVGQLNQMSPASPQGSPLPPNVPSNAPSAGPRPTPPNSQPSSEAELIIKALSQRLGAISAVDKAKSQPTLQSAPVGF